MAAHLSVGLSLVHPAQVVPEAVGDHVGYASMKPLLWFLGLQSIFKSIISFDPPINPVIDMPDFTVTVFVWGD